MTLEDGQAQLQSSAKPDQLKIPPGRIYKQEDIQTGPNPILISSGMTDGVWMEMDSIGGVEELCNLPKTLSGGEGVWGSTLLHPWQCWEQY